MSYSSLDYRFQVNQHSTQSVEKRLFAQDRHTFILDGMETTSVMDSQATSASVLKIAMEIFDVLARSVYYFFNAGIICLNAFISQVGQQREWVRVLLSAGDFIGIYCHVPLEICQTQGYNKALYKKIHNRSNH